jgi:uncharacterized protein with NAD-binding domain and iron-sulfur cluster
MPESIDVTIVGGGLAGLVAALRLAERQCRVTIYEGSDRVGGKAGSNFIDGHYEDHGFHIFPAWYLNVWKMVDQLGYRDHFVPVHLFHQLKAGEFPKFRTLDDLAAASTFLRNLTSGVMPIADMFLFYYTALDLMSRPLHYGDVLDETTITGFVHSRWYRNQNAETELQDLLLKAASAPTYSFSSLTMQKMLWSWMIYPKPMYHIAKGCLQEFFIQPIVERLMALGCQIHLNHLLERVETDGHRISRLFFTNTQTKETVGKDVDRVLLAIQPKDIIPLLNDTIFNLAPKIFEVKYLSAQPMAALNIYFKTRIPNIPKEHVGLDDSKYELSFLDISQTWQGFDKTVLNVVASDFIALENLSDAEVTRAMIAELGRYIPDIKESNIERTYLQPHLDQPLFMNYAGSWDFRPASDHATQLTNVYLAGDYCQTYVDLATMESATESGLRAAEALRKDAGVPTPIEILPIKAPPHWLLVIGRIVLLPVALIAKIWTLIFHQ